MIHKFCNRQVRSLRYQLRQDLSSKIYTLIFEECLTGITSAEIDFKEKEDG